MAVKSFPNKIYVNWKKQSIRFGFRLLSDKQSSIDPSTCPSIFNFSKLFLWEQKSNSGQFLNTIPMVMINFEQHGLIDIEFNFADLLVLHIFFHYIFLLSISICQFFDSRLSCISSCYSSSIFSCLLSSISAEYSNLNRSLLSILWLQTSALESFKLRAQNLANYIFFLSTHNQRFFSTNHLCIEEINSNNDIWMSWKKMTKLKTC